MAGTALAYFLVVVAVCLLSIEGDDGSVAFGIVLLGALILAPVAVGAVVNRWSACWLALLFPMAALSVDVLWELGVIDRSDEYEPLPITFIFVWVPWVLPAAALLIALGVAGRRVAQRARTARTA